MFFGFALPCGFMGTRGSLALQSIFIKEQESSFLTDLPHHQNPKGRKNIIITQKTAKGLPKYVFLSFLLLAKAANSRDEPLGPLQKRWGKSSGAGVWPGSAAQNRIFSSTRATKIRFCTWCKAHNLCKPSLQRASSHFLIAFLQRSLLSNAHFVEKLQHKQPTGK